MRGRVDLIEKLRGHHYSGFPCGAGGFDHCHTGGEIVRRVAQSAVDDDERLASRRGARAEIDRCK